MEEGEEATENEPPPEALLLREPVGEEVEDRDSEIVALKVCVTVPGALARLVALKLALTLCVRLPLPETLGEDDTEVELNADGKEVTVAPDGEATVLALLLLVLLTEEVALMEMESVPVREGVEVPLCVTLGLRLRVSVELTEREIVGEAEKEDDPEVLGLEEEDALEQPEAEPDWRADREAETEPVSL